MSLRWPEPLEELVGTSVDDLLVRLRKEDNVFSAETGGRAGAREYVQVSLGCCRAVDPTKRMQLKCNTSTTRPSLQHAIVQLVNELLATHRCRVQLEPEPAPPEPVPPELLPRLSRARSEPVGPPPLSRARTEDDAGDIWKTWDVRDFRRQEQTWRARADVPIDAGNVGDACDARQRRVGLNRRRSRVHPVALGIFRLSAYLAD